MGTLFRGLAKNVTKEDNSYMCTWFIELHMFITEDQSIWFGCKLQERVIFLVSSNCGEVTPSVWSALDRN